ncbi:hypothetical protein SISNIDRAFT_485231 [Sistotremastrum niveocremeum HHB9708]|uniref:RNase III domain-containing protein n=1 Tax=Sistotremastrum niveocremeum HHB9708 TaxID=1314777 RepID=A0A164UX84_9AGAM|nr:hypothetical protein SISNIDRAFT_485231 [Sistotremastrum niveocremeum HHB9708]
MAVQSKPVWPKDERDLLAESLREAIRNMQYSDLPQLPEILDDLLRKTVFNCAATSKEALPPDAVLEDFPASQPTTAHATNKLLELWGDAHMNYLITRIVERLSESKLHHSKVSLMLCRNDVLGELCFILKLLEHPDLCLTEADRWAIQLWIRGGRLGEPPKVLANLMEAYLGALWVANQGRFELMHQWLEPLITILYPFATTDADKTSTEQRAPFEPQGCSVCCGEAMYDTLDTKEYLPEIIAAGGILRDALHAAQKGDCSGQLMAFAEEVLQAPYSHVLETGEMCLRMNIVNAYLRATHQRRDIFVSPAAENKARYITKLRNLIMAPQVTARLAAALALSEWFASPSNQLMSSNRVLSQSFVAAVGWFDRIDGRLQELEKFAMLIIPAAIETLSEHGYHEYAVCAVSSLLILMAIAFEM